MTTIAEHVRQALVHRYPGLRFHVKRGKTGYVRLNGGGRNDIRSLVVEYNREGVTALGGNEASMRRVVQAVLDDAPVAHTVTAVRFEKYVSPKERERLKHEDELTALSERSTKVLNKIKRMIEDGEPEEAIVRILSSYKLQK